MRPMVLRRGRTGLRVAACCLAALARAAVPGPAQAQSSKRPAEAGSTLLAIARTGEAQLTLSWATSPGDTYTLQESGDLTSWTDVGAPISGDGMDASVAVAVSVLRRYYRLQIATSAVNDPYPALLEEAADRYAEAARQADPSAALGEFAGWLRGRPEVATVWTSDELSGVLVEAADGTLYAYSEARPLGSFPNAPVAPARPAAVSPAAEPSSSGRVRMPRLDRAGLFFGCGPTFTDAGVKVSAALEPLYGVNIDRGDLTLERLQHLDGYDVLLLDSHGDLLPIGAPDARFALCTLDSASDPAIAAAYADDFAEKRLTKMNVVWEEEGDVRVERGLVGAFPEFLQECETALTTDCLVIVNTCFSSARPELARLLLDRGASAYVGWTKVVGDEFCADQAIPYLVDRLAMANLELPHDPPMRPLSVAEALLVMQHPSVNLEFDAWNNSHLVVTPDQDGDEVVLRPTVRAARTSSTLVALEGFFGSQPGAVHLGADPLTIHSWAPTVIAAELSGGSGPLTVTAENRATSNAAELASYGFNVHIEVDHPYCDGELEVGDSYCNAAGAFLSASPVAPGATEDAFGWEPIERTFLLEHGAGLSGAELTWDLAGTRYSETDDYTYSTVVDTAGSRLFGDSEWFYLLVQDEQVSIKSSTIMLFVSATVTRVRKSDGEVTTYPLTIAVAPIASSLPSTATHAMDTGVVSSGQSVLVMPGPEPVTYQFEWGEVHPTPAVDLSKPR